MGEAGWELLLCDVNAERLASAAKAMGQGRGEMPEVQLRADEHVPYGRVVEVMGLAQHAGLNRIGFVTERPARNDQP